MPILALALPFIGQHPLITMFVEALPVFGIPRSSVNGRHAQRIEKPEHTEKRKRTNKREQPSGDGTPVVAKSLDGTDKAEQATDQCADGHESDLGQPCVGELDPNRSMEERVDEAIPRRDGENQRRSRRETLKLLIVVHGIGEEVTNVADSLIHLSISQLHYRRRKAGGRTEQLSHVCGFTLRCHGGAI